MKSNRHHRAFVFIDAVLALSLIGVLALTFALGAAVERRGMDHFSDTRAACRQAEQQLANATQTTIVAPCAESPELNWVKTSGMINGHTFDLIGLAPGGER